MVTLPLLLSISMSLGNGTVQVFKSKNEDSSIELFIILVIPLLIALWFRFRYKTELPICAALFVGALTIIVIVLSMFEASEYFGVIVLIGFFLFFRSVLKK